MSFEAVGLGAASGFPGAVREVLESLGSPTSLHWAVPTHTTENYANRRRATPPRPTGVTAQQQQAGRRRKNRHQCFLENPLEACVIAILLPSGVYLMHPQRE